MSDEMMYVVVYQPPVGWDLDQDGRDDLMRTGNVLEIHRTSLNSLQFTQLRLDVIASRPLGVVLLNVADRYDYRLGSDHKGERGEWEPFDVFEAKDLHEARLYCSHLRPRTYGDWANVPGDPSYGIGDRSELREYRVWEDYRTDETYQTSYRVVAAEKGFREDAR